MEFAGFSEKQARVLTWWCDASPFLERDAVICDGAVRSGKTFCMSLSFVLWATARFSGRQFGLCGKTIVSLRRNVLTPLIGALTALGFKLDDKISKNYVDIRLGRRVNRFFLFGGRDEAAGALIQGVTLAGALFDEAALMPRSFVEQACARCSAEGSKLWFNCNPEGPGHWFYQEWIKKTEERRALYFHFSMRDNPTLSTKMLSRYERMYSGVFYRRFVLGEWTLAEGRVYDFFDESMLCEAPDEREISEFAVSCDYGTANPASFGLWGRRGEIWFRLREYYYESRVSGSQKTDAEYADDLLALAGSRRLRAVVADPSAASFIEELSRRGLAVIRADNDVLKGIRITADLLKSGKLRICKGCDSSVREFALYSWDEGGGGRDSPLKVNDHAMDEIRYFAVTVAVRAAEGFTATWVERC